VNLARFPVRATDDIECRRPAGFPPTFLYSLSWEDPREDAKVLDITPNDTVLTLTSGGCNALDIILQVSTYPPQPQHFLTELREGWGGTQEPRSPQPCGYPALQALARCLPPAVGPSWADAATGFGRGCLQTCSAGMRRLGCHLQHVHFPHLAMGHATAAHPVQRTAPAPLAQPSALFHCGQCSGPLLWGIGGLCLLGVGKCAPALRCSLTLLLLLVRCRGRSRWWAWT
jgi:hypothetical protein